MRRRPRRAARQPGRRRRAEAEVVVGARGRRRIAREERDVIEVVVDLGRRLDEPDPEAFETSTKTEPSSAVSAVGKRLASGREAGHPQRHMLERAALARALGGEERELAAPGVGADERERVGAVDHVHAEVARGRVGDRVAVGDPEGDVVERLRLHALKTSHTHRTYAAGGDFLHGWPKLESAGARRAAAGLRGAARSRPGSRSRCGRSRFRGRDQAEADVAVVFRGRLIGRKQAPELVERGIPVIEVLTVEPPSASTAEWIRLSNRVAKADLAQIVRAVADWARTRDRSSDVAA